VEVDLAIFFLQDRGEGGSRVVLLAGMDGAGLESVKSFDEEIGTHLSQARG
jgi:hypothetical protein